MHSPFFLFSVQILILIFFRIQNPFNIKPCCPISCLCWLTWTLKFTTTTTAKKITLSVKIQRDMNDSSYTCLQSVLIWTCETGGFAQRPSTHRNHEALLQQKGRCSWRESRGNGIQLDPPRAWGRLGWCSIPASIFSLWSETGWTRRMNDGWTNTKYLLRS